VAFGSLAPFTTLLYAPTANGANGDTLQSIGATLYPVSTLRNLDRSSSGRWPLSGFAFRPSVAA